MITGATMKKVTLLNHIASNAHKIRRAITPSILDRYYFPPNDSGFGLHACTTQYADSSGLFSDWHIWKPRLQALGISWMKILDDGSGSSFQTAHRLIKECDIMPIVRFYRHRPNPHTITGREVDTARRYVGIGACYFETNNEPDLTLEWDTEYLNDGWLPQNWLEMVVNSFIQEAYWIREVGGWLLFPAFGPGGTGGANPFKMIYDRAPLLFEGNMCAAVHNYALCRPFEYPEDDINQNGTPVTEAEFNSRAQTKYKDPIGYAWETTREFVNAIRFSSKNPGATIMDDSTCWRAYEFVNAQVVEACGHSIPVFTTEGGYNIGQRDIDARYPKTDPTETALMQIDALKRRRPDYYIPAGLWFLAGFSMGYGKPEYEYQGPWWSPAFKANYSGCNGGITEDEMPMARLISAEQWSVNNRWPTPPTWGNDPDTLPPGGGEMWHDKYRQFLLDNPGNNTPAEFGIEIIPNGDVIENEIYFECIGITKIECAENNNNALLWIELIDENNKRLMGSLVDWQWEGMSPYETPSPVVIDKPPQECANLPLWANANFDARPRSYYLDGTQHSLLADAVAHVNTKIAGPGGGCDYGHHSFYVLFKRGIKGETEPPIEPPEPPADCAACTEAVNDFIAFWDEKYPAIVAMLGEINAEVERLKESCRES